MAAQFSVNLINLFDTPKEIHFGKWNSRPLVDVEWKKLKEAMTMQGIKSCSPEHMMPLIISPRHVEASCIETNLNGYEGKMLVLSAEGEREVKKLQMAGGRHRLAAIKSIKEDKDKELLKLTDARDKLSKRKVSKPDAVAKKMEEYEKKIAVLEEEISKIGIWGVILYNEGK